MEDNCNTGLCLGLGTQGYTPKKKKKQVGSLNLPFELCTKLSRDDDDDYHNSSVNDNAERN
ncbi:homeobox-leucine zipper protein HAT3 [Senna tora]|uniref:Homeobox-leucine zipper protein HAT3 n=1 Tax=Senna tora TaxID=362788 RepID=A0A834XIX5_9FABA|nr:homeobox-leucine zipper protein HAT3 [Senna tora]